MGWRWRVVAAAAVAVAATVLGGCGGNVAPVEGKVSYQGKPLEFGTVVFRPAKGPEARGAIGSDGTFRLSTFGNGDGAVLGKHQVAIICVETQRPGAQADAGKETGVGKSLIPRKYAVPAGSPLSVEVKEENEPFAFDLTE
jgi:hypothetical protein